VRDCALHTVKSHVVVSHESVSKIDIASRAHFVKVRSKLRKLTVNSPFAEARDSGQVARGLEPGRDISVVGTDDCVMAQYMKPPLTTVRIPRGRVADLAIRLLDEYWGRDKTRFVNVTVESDLVVRKSTCSVQNSVAG